MSLGPLRSGTAESWDRARQDSPRTTCMTHACDTRRHLNSSTLFSRRINRVCGQSRQRHIRVDVHVDEASTDDGPR